jgi:ATP-dependent RNA helicase DDX23/PRP28
MQAEEAKKAVEDRKKIEHDLKARKRELLKAAITGEQVGYVSKDMDMQMGDTTVPLTEEEKKLIKQRYLHKANETLGSTRNMSKPLSFDYDLDTEDTGGVDAYGVLGIEVKPKRDALDALDKRLPTSLTHWKQKLSSEMTQRDWRIFREDYQISVSGRDVPNAFRSWSESNLPRALLDAVHRAGYTKPTPIQMQAIPVALVPRDLIGISKTGSGKTAAFVLPMLSYIQRLPIITPESALDGPYALVLAPSRELAIQIEQEALKFSAFVKIRVCCIVGGRSAEQQTMTLSQGVELIVATPGRLADSLDSNQTVLNQCFYVVLDEADKMVDLGFEPFLNRILEGIPTGELANGQRRITQMFSATMPASVERLTRKYLVNPISVTVGDFVGGSAKSDITQRIEFSQTESEKRKKLYQVVTETEAPIIVFVNSKRAADQVGNQLDNAGYRVMVLHSGKMQQKREDAINQFKSGSADILVATDVAGRGLDIPDVKHVINYDMARTIEDYTHRIGRTGRAGKSGLATSFIMPYDEDVLPELKKFLEASKQFIPDELFRVATDEPGGDGQGNKRKRGDEKVYAF